ncbi:hypothetical protein HDU93_001646 [Gonapodya sp. JEL0774]|nr:hypothetical protein HDU93_001646 [Gonapodya sp. JEL0774]
MLEALEDKTFVANLTSCWSERAGCIERDTAVESAYARLVLDDFRVFVDAFERMLFPFVRGNFSSVSHLFSTFAPPRSRGIVISVGNDQVRIAIVAIRSVRAAGCTLPIEVAHAGDWDLSVENRAKIKRLGDGYDIVTRDLHQLIDNRAAAIWGWSLKPFAIMFSGFSEVVFQDADVVWFGSPNEVLEDPIYKKTGTLFYTDRRTLYGIGDDTYSFIISVLPKPLRDAIPASLLKENDMLARKSSHQMESGVVAVDKSRVTNFYGLLAACKLNCAEERDKVVYKRVFGDKETFWLGWEMAGMTGEYGWTPWPMAQVGYIVRGDQDAEWVIKNSNWSVPYLGHDHEKDVRRICSLQLGHLDATGTRLLWFNGGPLRDKFLGVDRSPVVSPSHWAIEHHSKWDMFTDSIACLYLKPGTGPDILDDGTVIEKPIEPNDYHLDHGDGHNIGKEKVTFVPSSAGGFGAAIPHKLSPKELKLFNNIKLWWEDARL